jgi:SAM-dependent methyltransferase
VEQIRVAAVAQPITRGFLTDLMAVLDLPDPIVEFGSMTGEDGGDSDLRPLLGGRELIGTDFREGPGVDRVEDLRELTFADGEVGTALCFDTLEHCEDPVTACRELTRVVGDGGICVISSVMLFGIHAYPGDYFRFTPDGFRSLLAGFDDVRVAGVGDPGIPREIFGVAAKGHDLGDLDLHALPTIAEAQAMWDDPAYGVKVGALRIPPGKLAGILAREVPKTLRAKLSRRRR